MQALHVPDDIFAVELPNRYPRLVNLYEKAKRDFWNESTEIDWDQEITLAPEQRRALAKLLSITYYGERAALTFFRSLQCLGQRAKPFAMEE